MPDNKQIKQRRYIRTTEKNVNKQEYIFREFNKGRKEADRKWIEAIDERIQELEIQVGIPELRRLKQKTMYRWQP